MRALLLAAAAFFALVAPASAVSPNLVVSQVYGGGGNTGATHTHDFIELFNRGPAGTPLNGMSLQYSSATGTGASSTTCERSCGAASRPTAAT